VRASWLFHMRQARQVLLQMATDLAPRIAGRPALECEQLLSATAAEVLGKLRGNPYGDVGACRCTHCGEQFALVGEAPNISAADSCSAEGKDDENQKIPEHPVTDQPAPQAQKQRQESLLLRRRSSQR
jgi:hypothetical protein